MNDNYIDTRIEFLNAAAAYFGLPQDQLMWESSVGQDIEGATLNACFVVALTPQNIIGIAKLMDGKAKEAKP